MGRFKMGFQKPWRKLIVNFSILFITLLGLEWGCTGSGAINPLSPQAATITAASSTSSGSAQIHWSSVPVFPTTTQTLNGVFMLSSQDGWACGNNGVILRYNGTSWAKQTLPFPDPGNLFSISFADSQDGFAVGSNGVILYYHDGTWAEEQSPTQNTLYAITVTPEMTAWAVGAEGTVLNFNGSTWQQVTIPNVTQNLYGVSLSSLSNGLIVGSQGTILRYNGQEWSLFGSNVSTERLNAVYTTSDSEAWAVGAFGTILEFNGTTWSSQLTPATGTDLLDVYVPNSSEGWAVGTQGQFLYFDGDRWILEEAAKNRPTLNAISFTRGNTGFTVGQTGSVFKYYSHLTKRYKLTLVGKVLKKELKPFVAWKIQYTIQNIGNQNSPEFTYQVKLPFQLSPLQIPTPTPTPLLNTTMSEKIVHFISNKLDLNHPTVTPTPVVMQARQNWNYSNRQLVWPLSILKPGGVVQLNLLLKDTRPVTIKKIASLKAILMIHQKAKIQAPILFLIPPKIKKQALRRSIQIKALRQQEQDILNAIPSPSE